MKEEKLLNLKKSLKDMESVLIAYSGGVDSTFLLRVAKDALADNVLAVTAESPTFPDWQLTQSKKLAGQIGIKQIFITTEELDNPNFVNNSQDRCYWCKQELFSQLITIAKKHDIKYVADGSNYDDIQDFRPGSKAGKELGIRSPLQEAEFTKEDIRWHSKQLGLPTWNKPSFACLSSRFPYGNKITSKKLTQVARAEDFLIKLGIPQVRVRHYDNTARIEVPENDITKLTNKINREKIVSELKKLGYTYITVDLKGYRTGSMNEILDTQQIAS